MSEYTLHHGDCLDILPTLEAGSVDAIICDPPYGTTACKWDSVIPFEPMWQGIKRVLKPRGACVLFGSEPFSSFLRMSNIAWYKYDWVWKKNIPTDFLNAQNKPLKEHECVCVFSSGTTANRSQTKMHYYPQRKRGRGYRVSNVTDKRTGAIAAGNRTPFKPRVSISDGDYFPTSILEFDMDRHPDHPTQKPLALLEYLVRTYTNAGDTVLDFTMGSGTAGHACGNLDRRFIGIEKDAAYFAISEERIATAYAPLRLMQEVV